MHTQVDEIADNIYRLSTFIPEIAPPAGFTVNQFLIVDDEPLLFHCGLRRLFPNVSEAVAKIIPVARLRWITFGHIEADECGAMNDWLAIAPHAQLAHGIIGCEVSLNDLADRPPRPLADGEKIALGTKTVRHIDTPQVPHGWDAGLIFEETTQTLFSGDLFTHLGDGPALTDGDIVGPAIDAENMFQSSALTPSTAASIRSLAALKPQQLAVMHGSSFAGDCSAALHALAADFDHRLQVARANANDAN